MTDSNGVTTWDKVKFGSYYQTAEFKTEPIKWRVLSVDGDDAFLLADECLDCKPYNTKNEDVTWETCSLRKWLNEDFYNEAFNRSEQAAIMETKVVNKDNPEYGTAGGNDTMDRIYLLSLDEAENADYGFASDSARRSKNTDYAKCNHAYSFSDGTGVWWLRSPGFSSIYASFVFYDGCVYRYGSFVISYIIAARPALHLNLSSSVYADAGEVDTEGNVTNNRDGIHAPVTNSEGVTTWDCVYLGKYKQKTEWKKELVEWRVLSVDGDDAFLLADKNLDCELYNTTNKAVTWDTCSLRKWLNQEFYNEAFSDSEQAAVMETKVVNADNPEYGTTGGNDTTDRIYLLSLDEVENADYGFVSNSVRESKNTDYAKCNYAGGGWWWLRSPGDSSSDASDVDHRGDVYWAGRSVNSIYHTVRPALHLNLSSSSWSKSGKVSSGEIEVPVPSESPSAGESSKPGGTPNQTATTPSPVGNPSLSTNPPQPTNALSVTASPVPDGNAANTGKLGSVSIKSAKNSKKSAAVLTWKKVNGASSYQIQYALDQKFAKGTKTKTTAGTSYTLKKLKKKKTYYVRIRALKKTGSKNVYGAWSKVKKVKIKK